MTKKIGINLMSLKQPNTGLYTFCKDLTKAILNHPSAHNYYLYLSKNKQQLFPSFKNFINHKIWHKLFFLSKDQEQWIWHNTSQGNNYYPKNKNLKKILTIHDLNYLIEKKDNPLKIKSYQNNVQKAVNYSDILVCISEFVKNQVQQNLNIQNKPIYVIYNGCEDISKQKEVEPKYRPKNKFLFSIGSIFPKKNFHVLPSLLKNNEFELIIVGNISDATYRDKIIAQAKLHGVEDRLHIIGPVEEGVKAWYYKNCEAFVFPSIAEGFGLPVIEAMHFQKPVFLSKHTSLPEIGGDVAYYFNDFEPETMQQNLKEGMAHFNNLKSTKAIKERAELFTWQKAAESYIKLYEQLM